MTRTVDGSDCKFTVPEDFVLPEVAGIVPEGARQDGPQVEILDTLYLDTTDLRLARWGATLRRRSGGSHAGWHLELLTDQPGATLEWYEPASQGDAVPDSLASLVFAYAAGGDLIPVTRVLTERATTKVVSASGAVLVTLTDDRATSERVNDRGVARRWRELAVRHHAGDAAPAGRLCSLLQAAGARPATSPTKLSKALGVLARQPMLPAVPKSISPKAGGGEVVSARLRAQVQELVDQDVAVRRGLPDAVHKMRVAVRRLRSLLGTFAPLFEAGAVVSPAAELRWLAGVLGSLRDVEVLAERLHASLDALPAEQVLGPVRASLDTELRSRTAAAGSEVRAALHSDRYAALLGSLLALAASPAVAGPLYSSAAGRRAADVLPPMVLGEHRRLRRRAEAALALPAGARRDVALHAVRKTAKRLRYAAETMEPVYGATAAAHAKAVEAVQETLGERQDSVVARSFLREEGARAGVRVGENGYTYGLLAGLEAARGRACEAAFAKAWKKAGRRRVVRWLR